MVKQRMAQNLALTVEDVLDPPVVVAVLLAWFYVML